MAAVLPHSTRRFRRAIVMPNLRPPVTTTAQALAYRDRIMAAVPADTDFEPLMTLYLTDSTSADEIHRAAKSGVVRAVKLYPAGATTNSESGVTDLRRCDVSLRALSDCGMPLLVHGEVTDPAVDVFDRELTFIQRILVPLLQRFPDLKVVLEHVTTRDAVAFVMQAPGNVAATITAHHLLLNRNDLLVGGLRPHHYCLPILKREEHRLALVEAATSGNPKFFLGTDSAPHGRRAKESACGCAGSFTAHGGIELYAEVFESAGRLDRLENFASHFGAAFYGVPSNTDTITLENRPWTVPAHYAFGDDHLVPLRAGEQIPWRLVQ